MHDWAKTIQNITGNFILSSQFSDMSASQRHFWEMLGTLTTKQYDVLVETSCFCWSSNFPSKSHNSKRYCCPTVLNPLYQCSSSTTPSTSLAYIVEDYQSLSFIVKPSCYHLCSLWALLKPSQSLSLFLSSLHHCNSLPLALFQPSPSSSFFCCKPYSSHHHSLRANLEPSPSLLLVVEPSCHHHHFSQVLLKPSPSLLSFASSSWALSTIVILCEAMLSPLHHYSFCKHFSSFSIKVVCLQAHLEPSLSLIVDPSPSLSLIVEPSCHHCQSLQAILKPSPSSLFFESPSWALSIKVVICKPSSSLFHHHHSSQALSIIVIHCWASPSSFFVSSPLHCCSLSSTCEPSSFLWFFIVMSQISSKKKKWISGPAGKGVKNSAQTPVFASKLSLLEQSPTWRLIPRMRCSHTKVWPITLRQGLGG